MPDDPGSWDARYRASLDAEERELERIERTPDGRMMRGRMWFGLTMVLGAAVTGGMALVTSGGRLRPAGGIVVLGFCALIVVSVAAGVVNGWRPGRAHGTRPPRSHR